MPRAVAFCKFLNGKFNNAAHASKDCACDVSANQFFKETEMNPGVKYVVFRNQRDDAVGYFLDNAFYDQEDRKVGHLDPNDNFVYYFVSAANPTVRIQGHVLGNILTRDKDGLQFRIEPA
jgi:hypothetical protein